MKKLAITIFIVLWGSMLMSAQTVHLKHALRAYYDFNGSAKDLSGNGLNGTIEGAELANDRYGAENHAFEFTESNSHISIPVAFPEESFTVAFWFKRYPGKDITTFLGWKQGNNGLLFAANNQFICLWNGDEEHFQRRLALGIKDHYWHHLALTVKDGNASLYVDGKLQIRGVAIAHAQLQHLKLGTVDPGNRFKGKMDDLFIYKRNLNRREVKALFNNQFDYNPATTAYAITAQSDVDKNIPETSETNDDIFALIVGNENYSNYNENTGSMANVTYARRDAVYFKKYVKNTLGVPESNIQVLKDATKTRMDTELETMNERIKNHGNVGRYIFYYAGHGYPTQERGAYIIPVDVGVNNVKKAGIELDVLYSRLADNNAGEINVFMDACFSGGGRLAGLTGETKGRALFIKPKKYGIKDRTVIFSAAQNDQTAWPMNDEYHGVFTYYLLKKLQETGGDVGYGELADFLRKKTTDYTLNNHKKQTPETRTSRDLKQNWKGLEWKR